MIELITYRLKVAPPKADATKRNKKNFQALSEPILNGDIELNTIWPTTNDVLTYISFIMTILISLVSGWLFFKQRKLLLIISLKTISLWQSC